jgi:hypothetical protein
MRLYFAALVFFTLPLTAAAQHNLAESNWLRVQALAPGTTITIQSAAHKTRCRFLSATPEALTCARGSNAPQTFDRPAVSLVQQSNRAKSTLLGLGIGTAGGAVFGAAVGRSNSFVPRGAAALDLGAVGAIVGTTIGAAGNFAHHTVYRAP